MKRLLILGASILQLPAIKKAKQKGYYTIVADMNPNAIGVQYADEFHCVSTIDIEGVTNLAEEIKPDGIMTLATDMPMRAIAAATTRLGLPGITIDTAIKSTDKGEMIKAFEEHNVEHPWYYIVESPEGFDSIVDCVNYPCVIKPTDNAGNRGVSYAANRQELAEAYKYSYDNSRSGHVIIEEYMEGEEVSVEVIVYKGQVNILAITDKLTLGKPYFVEVGHAEQSQKSKEVRDAIADLATRAVKAVGIDNSPAHVEIMVTKDGPKMVELGSRMGGGCITTHLVPLSTGIDMIECVMDMTLGIEPDLTPKFSKGSALRHIVGVEGIIEAIDGINEAQNIPGVIEVTMLKEVGSECHYFKNGSDRVGYVIAQGENTAEAIAICEKAIEKVNIKTR